MSNRQEVVINKDSKFTISFTRPIQKYEINGNLHIESVNTPLKILADEIIVYGDLIMENASQVLRLCNTLTVYGDIQISNCNNLRILAKEYKIMGDALIEDCTKFNAKLLSIDGEVEFDHNIFSN